MATWEAQGEFSSTLDSSQLRASLGETNVETQPGVGDFYDLYAFHPESLIDELITLPQTDEPDEILKPEALEQALETHKEPLAERLQEATLHSAEIQDPGAQSFLANILTAASGAETQRRHPQRLSDNTEQCLANVSAFYTELLTENLLLELNRARGRDRLIVIYNFFLASWEDNNEATAVIATIIVDDVCGKAKPPIDITQELTTTFEAANGAVTNSSRRVLSQARRISRVLGRIPQQVERARSRKRKQTGKKIPLTPMLRMNLADVMGVDREKAEENEAVILEAKAILEQAGLPEDDITVLSESDFPQSELLVEEKRGLKTTRGRLGYLRALIGGSSAARERAFPAGTNLRSNPDVILVASLWRHYSVVDSLVGSETGTEGTRFNSVEMQLLSEYMDHCPWSEDANLMTRLKTFLPRFINVPVLLVDKGGQTASVGTIRRRFRELLVFRLGELAVVEAERATHKEAAQGGDDFEWEGDEGLQRDYHHAAESLMQAMFPQYARASYKERFDLQWRIRTLKRTIRHSGTRAISYSGNSFTYEPNAEPKRNTHLGLLGVDKLTLRRTRPTDDETHGVAMATQYPYSLTLETRAHMGDRTFTVVLDRDFDVFFLEPTTRHLIPLQTNLALRNYIREFALEHILAIRLGPRATRSGSDEGLPTIAEGEVERAVEAPERTKSVYGHAPCYFESRTGRPVYGDNSAALKAFLRDQETKGYIIPLDIFSTAVGYIERLIANGHPIAEKYCRRNPGGEIIAVDSVIFRLLLGRVFTFEQFLNAHERLVGSDESRKVQLHLRDLRRLANKEAVEVTFQRKRL